MALPWKPISELPDDLEFALIYGTHAVDRYKQGWPDFQELEPHERVQVGYRPDGANSRHPLVWIIEDNQGGWYMRATHFAFLDDLTPV